MDGATLKRLRLRYRLTQAETADQLGYTTNYIARLERGEERITQRFALLVRKVLQKKKAPQQETS